LHHYNKKITTRTNVTIGANPGFDTFYNVVAFVELISQKYIIEIPT